MSIKKPYPKVGLDAYALDLRTVIPCRCSIRSSWVLGSLPMDVIAESMLSCMASSRLMSTNFKMSVMVSVVLPTVLLINFNMGDAPRLWLDCHP